MRYLIAVIFIATLACCNQPPKGLTLQEYFGGRDSGVQTGGVKMVVISEYYHAGELFILPEGQPLLSLG